MAKNTRANRRVARHERVRKDVHVIDNLSKNVFITSKNA